MADASGLPAMRTSSSRSTPKTSAQARIHSWLCIGLVHGGDSSSQSCRSALNASRPRMVRSGMRRESGGARSSRAAGGDSAVATSILQVDLESGAGRRRGGLFVSTRCSRDCMGSVAGVSRPDATFRLGDRATKPLCFGGDTGALRPVTIEHTRGLPFPGRSKESS